MPKPPLRSMGSWIGLAGAVIAVALSGLAWVHFHDDHSSPGTAVFGAYRERWFLLCVAMTYSSFWALAISIWRFSHRTLLRLVLLHCGLLMPLVVLEGLALTGVLDCRSLVVREGHLATKQGDVVDPRLRWVGVPNNVSEGTALPNLVGILGADASPLEYKYQTDGRGLRNPREKPDARVLCLGDSILVAGLVPIENTVTEQLERRLGVPVMNVAEVGYAPQEELIRLETLGLQLKGQLVLQFFFEGNDLTDSKMWRSGRARPESSSWPANGLVKMLLGLLHRPKRSAGARRAGVFNGAGGESVSVYFLYDAESIDESLGELDELRSTFREARDRFQQQGAGYAIVFVPAKLTVLHAYCKWRANSVLQPSRFAESTVRQQLAQLCKKEGIPFRDLTPALRAVAAQGKLPYFAADTHLNATGHATMAEALSAWVATLIPGK